MKKQEKLDQEGAKRTLRLVAELYEDSKDYIDKHELGGYIGKQNEPKVGMMDESEDIGAQDVLMLGSYMTLRKLMHTYMEEEKPEVSTEVHVITGIDAIKKLPPEVQKALKKHMKELFDEDGEPKKGKK